MIFKFELKEKVKDTITGFKGVIACRVQWMNGCVRYVVLSSKRTADGKEIEATIDEQQLVSMEKPKETVKNGTGGPKPHVSAFNGASFRR